MDCTISKHQFRMSSEPYIMTPVRSEMHFELTLLRFNEQRVQTQRVHSCFVLICAAVRCDATKNVII